MSTAINLSDIRIHPSWEIALQDAFGSESFKTLREFVRREYSMGPVYPEPRHIFRAMDLCPLDQVKVVILGQDPYHGASQANGLSFAVGQGSKIPPSLLNIFKEMESDLGLKRPQHGDLSGWASQGVLLLNASLTVRAGQAGSHQNQGWEEFTDAVIRAVSARQEPCVFLLWGNYAKAKIPLINGACHAILSSAHPSPFSAERGFFGSRPFSKTNAQLQAWGVKPIDWRANLCYL